MDKKFLWLRRDSSHHEDMSGLLRATLDGPNAKVRDAVHVLWAGEKPVPDALEATPAPEEMEEGEGFKLVPLEDLEAMLVSRV